MNKLVKRIIATKTAPEPIGPYRYVCVNILPTCK